MEGFADSGGMLLLLFFGGVLISIFGSVVGGSLFLSVPFVSLLFPGISLASAIGNIKVGSTFRGLGFIAAVWREIEYKRYLPFLFLLFFGTVLGVLAISALDKKWLLPLLCFAILFVEVAPKVAHKISKKMFLSGGFLAGMYYGFFGPGIHFLLLALLRTQNPKSSQIVKNKMQIIYLETMVGFWAIFMHFSQGHLVAKIWICWAAGSLVGGILGGKILQKVGKMPGGTQTLLLRISFVIALLAAGATYF